MIVTVLPFSSVPVRDAVFPVSVEGVEFVDEARCYEMGKNRDEITGFVTPYWTHLSDIENGDYDNVFGQSVSLIAVIIPCTN